MKYFCLPNTAWLDVEQIDPQDKPEAPYVHEDERPTKSEYRAWCNAQSTKHCFYSVVEGLNPNGRVTVENPAYRMHGLVIDFDANIDDESIALIQKNGEAGLLPRWVTKTFSENYRRLIWEFEAPVMVDNEEISERFIKLLVKKLKIRNILPGFDEASLRLSQVFERGYDWKEVDNWCPVPSAVITHLFVQAATSKTLRGTGPDIPIAVVAAEVEKRWPGRIIGEFVEGARTPLFWIDDGIDRIGAQVGTFGMLCYSERAGKSFVHWGEILGPGFVEQFEAERIGAAAEGIWFDGRHYWHLEEDGRWANHNKDDTVMHLKVQGIEARLLPGLKCSEAEKVLVTAQKLRTVKAAAPIVHDTREVVHINGERYLNISTTNVVQPAEKATEADFPWLAEFFWKIWDDPMPDQRDHFLAWVQHFYSSALKGRPQQGQAVIIAGPPSAGKTFLNHQILGRAMGGHSDPTDFLMAKTNFNKSNSEVALWCCDDTRGASSWENKAAFSGAVKKHVANPSVRVEGKNQNSFEIPWRGRIVITCNTDKESLEVIPQLNATIKDKICLFWMTDKWQASFLPAGGTEDVVARELPFFLRWLLDWKTPEYVLSDNPRYHVKSFHHEKMLHHAHDSSPAARLTELLDLWFENIPTSAKVKPIWVNPARLRKQLSEDPSSRDALKEFSRNRMASALETLGYKTRISGNSTEYLIWEPKE